MLHDDSPTAAIVLPNGEQVPLVCPECESTLVALEYRYEYENGRCCLLGLECYNCGAEFTAEDYSHR
jgi:hypothetical protein